MKNSARLTSSCLLGASMVLLAGDLEFAKSKVIHLQPKLPTYSLASLAAAVSPATVPSAPMTPAGEKVIMVLQTREHRVTVFSGEKGLHYSVATDQGIALADRLEASELKNRFPGLYEIIAGTAWAGL